MQDTPKLSFGNIEVRFSNFGSITEINNDAYCYYVDDSGAKSHMFESCSILGDTNLGFNVVLKAPKTWNEDQLFNVKFCNIRFPAGKPAVTISYKLNTNEVLTSGAVDYDKDLPAKAATL